MEITQIIDYNGAGKWSANAIQERYVAYANKLKVFPLRDLTPRTSEFWDKRWIYPVMNEIIEGIKQGDRACIEIGVEFIEEDERFSFGRTIKSKTARVLRRAELTSEQIQRIRKRVVHMLVAEHVPREYQQYSRLLRKVGMGDWWPFIEERANLNNPYVMRYYNYFEQYVHPK